MFDKKRERKQMDINSKEFFFFFCNIWLFSFEKSVGKERLMKRLFTYWRWIATVLMVNLSTQRDHLRGGHIVCAHSLNRQLRFTANECFLVIVNIYSYLSTRLDLCACLARYSGNINILKSKISGQIFFISYYTRACFTSFYFYIYKYL